MAEVNHEKYFVRKPVFKKGIRTIKGRQAPTMTYMSNDLVPGCNIYIELTWVNTEPEPNPHILEHTHDYDEIVMHIGGDPYHPEDLGGEIEYHIGGQRLTFSTTTALYIPKGVKHGTVTWKRVDKPHLEMAIVLGGANTGEGWSSGTIRKPEKGLPGKEGATDYEKFLVRDPLYQEERKTIKDGRGPVTVYICNDLIPEVNMYIDYVWILDVPPPHIFEHVHEKYDEIVLHIGGDPDNPEDLGSEIDYYVGGQLLTFDTTTAIYVPKGLKHGPLNWKRVDKPHLQMPIIIGAGSMAEAMPGGYQVEQ